MKVLVWLNGSVNFGGHEVQLTELIPKLISLGVDVELTEKDPETLRAIDIVHGLGLTPAQVRLCREAGVPVVLSTVYGSRSYTHQLLSLRERPQLERRLRLGVSLGIAGLRLKYLEKSDALAARLKNQALSFESADLLMPNARGEESDLRTDLGVTTPALVVPNGADPDVFSPAAPASSRRGVLAVGRFEPHKNQLGLIKALKSLDAPLRVVGPAHPDHAAYALECERAAGADVTVDVRRLAHPELAQLYQQCAVHVLASWFETTGLVSLEAALCGARVVSTMRGHAREYLQDDAWYCDPARPSTIRRAVEDALAARESSALRERVLERYTWRHAAEMTLRAYETALAAKPRS